MKKYIYNVLILFSLGAALYSAYRIFTIQAEYRQGEKAYAALHQYAKTPEEKTANAAGERAQEQEAAAEAAPAYPEVDFAALQELNPEVIAWIYMADSTINYPVVKTDNNDYYLNRLVDGTYNASGSIFADYRNTEGFVDYNNIIYGHHMKNGTMFSALTRFEAQDYYESHKKAYLITPNQHYELEFFSGYVTDIADNAWELAFEDAGAALAWAQEGKKKSLFRSGISPAEGDRYVTLSTCTYDFDDARFVLVGKLKEIP